MLLSVKNLEWAKKSLSTISKEVTRCQTCSSVRFDLIDVHDMIRLQLCLSCGISKGLDPLRKYYLLTKYGIVSLRSHHLTNPKVFLDDFIVSPVSVREARRKSHFIITRRRGEYNHLVWIYNEFSKGKDGMFIECNESHLSSSTVIVHSNISHPLRLISPCRFEMGKLKCKVLFVEPRLKQVKPIENDKYKIDNIIRPFREAASGLSESKEFTTSSICQLLMSPFTDKYVSRNWALLMMGSKLIFLFSNGLS